MMLEKKECVIDNFSFVEEKLAEFPSGILLIG